MQFRLWIVTSIWLVMCSGCTKTEPRPPSTVQATKPSEGTPASENNGTQSNTQPSDEDVPQLKPAKLPTQADFEDDKVAKSKNLAETDAEEMDEDEDDPYDVSPERQSKLLAKVEKDPKDVKSWISLAQISQLKARMTEDGNSNFQEFKNSADYIRKALVADPEIGNDFNFRGFCAHVFYNEACAFSQEKQNESALKRLTEAVDYGYTNYKQIQADPDLQHVRTLPEFEKIVDQAKEKRREEVKALVGQAFESQPQFKFDFDLKDSEGNPVSKVGYAGKLVMVNVWGTWCPPCRAELPELVAAQTKYKSDGFEIIGLNSENSEGDEANTLINESKKRFGLNYPCALGDEKTFGQIPDFGAVPTSIFLDRAGVVKAVVVGMVDELQLEMIVERLKAESPATVKPENSAETKTSEVAKPADEEPGDAKSKGEKTEPAEKEAN